VQEGPKKPEGTVVAHPKRRGEGNRELVWESAAAWRKRYPVAQETPLINFGVAFLVTQHFARYL
jgi:hypothetical protein